MLTRAACLSFVALVACGPAPRPNPVEVAVVLDAAPPAVPVAPVDAGTPAPPAAMSGAFSGGRVHRLATNTLATCLVKGDGSIHCLGSLGFRDPHSKTNAKTSWPVEGIPAAVEVALGGTHGCARTANGEVWCWGSNFKGELGRGTATGTFEPAARVSGLANVAQIAAGFGAYTCARTGDGNVVCWGNPNGEMEKLDSSRASPAIVSGVGDVVDVAVGSADACATTAAGNVLCWTANEPRPRERDFEGARTSRLADVTSFSVGPDSACARTKDGGVVTTPLLCEVSLGMQGGMPTIGRGNASWTAAKAGAWTKVPGIANASAVAAGGRVSCAIGDDGNVRCWGCSPWPFLAGGAAPAKPAVVPNVTDVDEIVMGLVSACVRKRDDSVMCWGTSMTVQADVPTRVTF